MSKNHYSIVEVTSRLGVPQHSLYEWEKRYSLHLTRAEAQSQQAELRWLKAEFRRVTNSLHDGADKIYSRDLFGKD